MITTHPLVLVLYWIALVLTLGATVVFSALAWRRSGTAFAYATAGGLGLALILASVPADGGAGFGVSLLVSVLAIAAAVLGGGPVATLVLGFATHGRIPEGVHGGIVRSSGGTEEEVLRGGTAIGLLERIAVAGTLLAGFPEGLAVVVAVKGVGRFTELDDAATRERFIIGSLVSLIWAAAASGVALLARS